MTMTTIELLCRRLWPNVWSLAAGGAVALALLAGGVTPLAAQSIACMVNGEPITGLDIEQRTKLNFLTTRKQMSRQEVLDELTNEKVKIKEAKRFGVDPSASDVDQSYAGMSQRMRLSPEQLTKSLESQGIRPESCGRSC
jgi:peptidyl-prolyl cis-trans isomerase SurA